MAFLPECIYVYIKKNVKFINHDCLPIFMLLCMMLYIIPAYLMLFFALPNAVCLYNALTIFWPLIFVNAFCLHALSWFIDTVCLFQVLFCIMHSAFNLFVFPISMFIPFFVHLMKELCALKK